MDACTNPKSAHVEACATGGGKFHKGQKDRTKRGLTEGAREKIRSRWRCVRGGGSGGRDPGTGSEADGTVVEDEGGEDGVFRQPDGGGCRGCGSCEAACEVGQVHVGDGQEKGGFDFLTDGRSV